MKTMWQSAVVLVVLAATGCQVEVEPREGPLGVVRQAVGPTAPIGNHEGLYASLSTSRYFTEGWACDPDSWSTSLVMHFYMDGTYATGTLVDGVVANRSRPDVVGVCGGTTMHGWRMDLPDNPLWLHGTHSLYGYAINDNEIGPNPMLGSPSFTYYKIAGNVGQSGVTVSVGPRSAVSDAGGNYEIRGLVPNTWTVTPSKGGCTFSPSSMAVTVAPDGANKNFAINCGSTTYSISGNAGTPSATLTAGAYSTSADGSGSYTLGSLPAGTYTVTPSKAGCTFSPTSRSVTVGPNATGQGFTATCPGSGWSGPAVSVISDGERKKLRVCPQGGGACSEGVPLFLALNTQNDDVGAGNWADFDAQVAAMSSHLQGVAGAVPILEVNLLNTSQGFLSGLTTHLNQLPADRRPYLLARWFIEASSGEQLRGVNMAGQTNNPSFPDPGPSWVASAKSEAQNVLTYLDQNYPNKVMGFMPAALTSGEWFLEPTTKGLLGAGPTLPWAWETMNDFYYPSVTASAVSEFCSWGGLPADLKGAACRAPTLGERNGGVTGGPAPPSFVLDPSNVDQRRAAYFNQHQSYRIANAIDQLCATAKSLSGNRIFTVGFYGYLFGREWNLPASGHLGLKTLLASPAVDAIAAPLNYNFGRDMGEPFIPQGPLDTPNLYNKLWVHEDDTRTLFVRDVRHLVGYSFATNVPETNALLRRNAIAAALHGNGLYWLDLSPREDLPGGGWKVWDGWFGRADRPVETDQLWDNLADVVAQADRISTGAPNAYAPQIAVFVDDLSLSYVTAVNPAGTETYNYAISKSYSGPLDALARIGAPYRVYRLDDLQSPNFPASSVKLAVFLNTYNVNGASRAAIASKLKVAGKTLLFIHGSGYLNGDAAPSTANMEALTGLTTHVGSGAPALQVVSTISPSYGPNYPITPWFYFGGTADDLGRYDANALVALAKKTFSVAGGSYAVVGSAVPGLPKELYRQLASDAGVHFFAPLSEPGDVVEARGNTLMVAVKSAGTRTITLPSTPSQLYINTGSGETLCSSQASCLTRHFATNEVVTYRWQ